MTLNTLITIPYDKPGEVFTREMRCQEKKEILGTAKPPLTPALLCALFQRENLPFKLICNSPASKIKKELADSSFIPGLILLPTCTPTISRDMDFIAELKSIPGVTIAAFGPHTSGIPRETLEQFPQLDIAIAGEPEETAVEIAKGVNLSEIDGIAYRNANGEISLNAPRKGIADINSLPLPSWELFSLDQYVVPVFGKKFILLETSRGCPYNCGFCVVPLTHGNIVREKSVERIIDEIRSIRNKFGIDFFYIWGDTAVLNKNKMAELCEAILREPPGIEWISNTRPEVAQDFDFVKLLRRAGCRMLSMGAESGDEEILSRMGKKLQLETLVRSVAALREAGIKSFVFFIFGYPGETSASMKSTLEFALSLNPDYANFYPAVPYPGTPLWDYCRKENLLISGDWAKIDFTDYILRLPGIEPADVLNIVRAARRKFYFRPSYIIKSLKDAATHGKIIELAKAIPAYLKT